MAYTSGTAANYKDLLAAMVTFASANGWVVLEQSETKVYMKGTGLSGLDEIYVGVETYENPTSGIYNWNLYGSWGYRAGRAFNKMPRSSWESTYYPVGCFWNTSMDYWMTVDARRIILVAKVGATYHMVHLGLLTVPATDAQYPYPLLLSGTHYSNTFGYATSTCSSVYGVYNQNYCGARLHFPHGAWGAMQAGNNFEYRPLFTWQTPSSAFMPTMLTGLDGTYLLEPIYIVSTHISVMGHIEGLYKVTGYNNSSENIITVDGVNYICFQDCGRVGFGDFCAMRMS